MELHLIVPVPEVELSRKEDEKLNGKWWRVKGPLDAVEMNRTKFHCISYVWGKGIDKAGSFFDCQRDISDQTRHALEAAMKAADAIYARDGGERIDAFWIDAICVPQVAGASRHGTLESMGFIYNAAVSVIVVLQGPAWEVVKKASMSNTALALSEKEMEDLELDTWISRVWTYQEMVNNNNVQFTAMNSPDNQVVASYVPLLDCVGYSSEQWQKQTQTPQSGFLKKFPHLDNLTDTLLDARISGYLERSALGVLSNMAARNLDPQYPGNRLLASLGALTQKPSWSPAETLPELSAKLMSACEKVDDYSFIYTSDKRDERPGSRWRPSPQQPELKGRKPIHLVPVLNWSSYGEPFGETQRGHKDSVGFWLDNMIRLRPSEVLDTKAQKKLDAWLYSWEYDPTHPDIKASLGFFGPKERGKMKLSAAMFKAFEMIGFTKISKWQVCENGLFFSVVDWEERQDVELFAASSIRWAFGAPGLARWKDEGVMKYSAGVFAGLFEDKIVGESLLME